MMDDTPKTAATELVSAPLPPAPLDITKLQSGDAIELARLQQMTAQAAQTDAQRLAQIASGRPLDMSNETTIDNQLSNANFSSAVAGLLEGGARVDLVLNYLEHGKSDDPRGHEFAAEWFRRLEHDSEMQAKLLRNDPETRRQFLAASMYMAGRHDQET
jgi:hypothetical protein